MSRIIENFIDLLRSMFNLLDIIFNLPDTIFNLPESIFNWLFRIKYPPEALTSQAVQRDTKEVEVVIRDFEKADSEATFKVTKQDLEETDKLISTLYNVSKGKKSRTKRHEFVHQPSGVVVSSWKMNEWDYKKNRTPTQARGLFTKETGNNRHEIVVRGYNKFFNVGEVDNTQWENIITQTKGPYEVTVKENGCIIFISGLPGDLIIVTSKHSMGERENAIAHAVVGEQWLDKHLAKVKRSKKELARFLYENRLTAVAELCDDQFEEHVLPYTSDSSGLYLHGINLNTADLRTWPSERVKEFSKYWGFNLVKYYIKQTVDDVKKFTDKIKEISSLDGRPIEGFVIRTKNIHTGQDFFFKIKYDEPYLMYREWREVTKSLLSNKKPRATFPLSRHYIEWVKAKIKTHPELFEEYKKNHGIYRVREMFLEYWKDKGDDVQKEVVPVLAQEKSKTLLVPVATIGCGKTTLALALAKLFSFGHIQNDDIVGKKTRVVFYKRIIEGFESHDVVIADRNNHLRELRETLIDDVTQNVLNVRIVAICWDHIERTSDEIFKITSERVIARGTNHQSLTPEVSGYKKIMQRFLNDFEPLNSNDKMDKQFDYVIDLDIANDIKTNLEIVIDELKSIIGVKKPSKDEIETTLEEIEDYKPTVRKVFKRDIKYYGIELDFDVKGFLTKFYEEHPNENSETFDELVQKNRIYPTHHVTLVHSKELKIDDPSKNKQKIWEECRKISSNQVKVYINKVVFDSEIMALVVDRIDPLIRSTSEHPHITVGTVEDSVKPFQANALCESALSNNGGETICLEQELVVDGTIKEFYNPKQNEKSRKTKSDEID